MSRGLIPRISARAGCAIAADQPAAELPVGTTLAHVARFAVERADLTINDVVDADEIFLTNSSWGVMPVVRVERHQVGSGAPGPIARAMREKWLA